MENVYMQIPTKLYLGKGQLQNLPTPMKAYGTKVLFVYGGGSIKKTGLYDQVVALLNDNGFSFWELSGVKPNPRASLVREGIKICRENGIEVILAVGGGSVFDTAKAVAAGVNYDGDFWDFAKGKANAGSVKVLPVAVVSTMTGTGSEFDTSCVITNEETNEKMGFSTADMRPRIAILDPTYTYTLPKKQTAAGVTDIMSHVFEYYFNNDPTAYFQNRLCESFLKTVIKYGHVAYDQPDNYEARYNLLWASVWALTGIIGKGYKGNDKYNGIMWSAHMLEHDLGAYYFDVTHGEGLAIITLAWFKYCMQFEETLPKFREYAVNVWDIDPTGKSDRQLAEEAIQKTEDYWTYMNMPKKFTDLDPNITDEHFEAMAEHILEGSGADLMSACFVPLNKENIIEIFKMCL